MPRNLIGTWLPEKIEVMENEEEGKIILLLDNERTMVIDRRNRKMCCYKNGRLHDPAPGVPAYRRWYPGRRLELEVYFHDGRPHNPVKVIPAYRRYSENGYLVEERHYFHGRLQNPGPYIPAVKKRNSRGRVIYTANYENGRKIGGKAVL